MAIKTSLEFTAKPRNTLFSQGKQLVVVPATAPVKSADSDGDIYVLARGIPLSAILLGAFMPRGHGSVTGGTSFDIGVYKNTGTYASPVWKVVDKDIFCAAKDFSTGVAYALDVCTSVRSSTIGELLSLNIENENVEYAIVLTANTVGSADVDLSFELKLAQAF